MKQCRGNDEEDGCKPVQGFSHVVSGCTRLETMTHLQSVQCVSQVDAVTAAHNRCWNVITDMIDRIVKNGSEN